MKYSEFEGKTFLITGAYGLIGKAIVKNLILNVKHIKIIAVVRNKEKAEKTFSPFKTNKIELKIIDILDLKPENLNVDYIIHTANITSSRSFVEYPVEVIMQTVLGTKNILEFARVNPIKSFVFLSTMEIYGAPLTDNKINENSGAILDCCKTRSSYPEAKRLCECLCASYCAEYNVPIKIARLTQTFGEGVEYSDKRVFAEFLRCAIEGKNIIIKSTGETKRNYLYVYDAVEAIFTILVNGKNAEAYNCANENTYCSILDMANLIKNKISDKKIEVIINEDKNNTNGYAPILHMNLSAEKLKNIGFEAKVSLEDMLKRTYEFMKKVEK